MQKILIALVLAAVTLISTGCATKTRIVNEHGAYKEYLATQKEMDNNWAEAVKAVVSSEDKCLDDTCRVSKSFAAAMVLQNRPSNATGGLQPFRHEPTFGEKVALSLAGQAGGILGTLVNGAVAVKQSDNQTSAAINDSDNRAAISLGGFNALAQVGTAAANRTTYSVGGNFGNTYGDNFTGGDRADVRLGSGAVFGSNNDVANGDQNFNRGRIGDEYVDQSIGSCDGAPGGSGAPGAPGTGGAGTGTEGGAGTGGSGGSGAPGGTGGNCSTGRSP